MVGKYKVITLCGSTKFKDYFLREQIGNKKLKPPTSADFYIKKHPGFGCFF